MNITFELIGNPGSKAGGRIANVATFTKSSYEVYADNKLIGYMREIIDGVDIRTGWKFQSFNYPTFETETINATQAKSEIKRYINNS